MQGRETKNRSRKLSEAARLLKSRAFLRDKALPPATQNRAAVLSANKFWLRLRNHRTPPIRPFLEHPIIPHRIRKKTMLKLTGVYGIRKTWAGKEPSSSSKASLKYRGRMPPSNPSGRN